MTSDTDRIEKKVVLRAPRARVWRAISDSTEFGSWFGVKFDAPFVPGVAMQGVLTPTTVDPEAAERQRAYEGRAFGLMIDKIEPMELLSFRWHPYAVEPNVDYSAEPMTLVTFELADDPAGTLLTITESGFDAIPIARRAKAFAANDGGWTAQAKLVEKYIAHGR